jgi:hypothetical protein
MARLAAAAAAAAVAVAVVAEAGVLPTVEWDAELDVFELLERRGEPFLLTNSPTQRWSAHAAWAASPAELLDEAGEALLAKGVRATERSSSEFLYFNDDKEAVPYLQNEAWWLQAPSAWLESRGTAHPHPDASKNFYWQRPHRFGAIERAEFLRRLAADSDGHVYVSRSIGDSAKFGDALRARLKPLAPLLTAAEREQGRADAGEEVEGLNIWIGSPNATATLHYDGEHNMHVQVAGRKEWTILPPRMLPATRLHPLGHPSQRQAYPPESLSSHADREAQTQPKSHAFAAAEDGYRRLSRLPMGDVDVSDDRPAAARAAEAPDALRFVAEPGDVLCLPALWMHSVRSLGSEHGTGGDGGDGGGGYNHSVSVNRWRPAPSLQPLQEAAMLELPPEELAGSAAGGGHSHDPMWAGLQKVTIAVIATVLKSRQPPLCPMDQPARQCTDGFIRVHLQQRWAPLLNFSSPWASHACPPLTGGARLNIAGYVETLLNAKPAAALSTVLADWVEGLCYQQVKDLRSCPFFLHSCVCSDCDLARGGQPVVSSQQQVVPDRKAREDLAEATDTLHLLQLSEQQQLLHEDQKQQEELQPRRKHGGKKRRTKRSGNSKGRANEQQQKQQHDDL